MHFPRRFLCKPNFKHIVNIICAVIVLLFTCVQVGCESQEKQRGQMIATQQDKDAEAREHLAAAKRLLQVAPSRPALNRASEELRAIPPTSQVYSEALLLLNDVHLRSKTLESEEARRRKQAATEARRAKTTNDQVFKNCRQKLRRAQTLDVLYDLNWSLPDEPRVLVGPTFFDMPIDAKEGFARTLNCFLMAGDETKLVNFDLRDWRTGKRVGRWSYGKLKMD